MSRACAGRDNEGKRQDRSSPEAVCTASVPWTEGYSKMRTVPASALAALDSLRAYVPLLRVSRTAIAAIRAPTAVSLLMTDADID
jgi:hypothetical protein